MLAGKRTSKTLKILSYKTEENKGQDVVPVCFWKKSSKIFGCGFESIVNILGIFIAFT